jgi:hypothetical protein
MEVAMAIPQTAEEDDYSAHWRAYRRFIQVVQMMVAGILTLLIVLAYTLL